MCRLPSRHLFNHLLVCFFLLFSACEKISVPRLGFETEPEPRLAFDITYAFTDQLLHYTKKVEACGLDYTVPVGDLVVQTFMKIGEQRFNTVRAEPPVGQAKGAPPNGYRILLDLNQYAFDPVTRTGEEDRYHAFVDMQMQAVYEDPAGTALAKSPLTSHTKVSLWTPALTSQSISCNTAQIDQTVTDGAEVLAKEMISVLPRLSQNTLEEDGPQNQERNSVQDPITTRPASVQGMTPVVQFRTKLVDANRNLVLEGGEALALLIETTNISEKDIPSAYVELRGTPILVEAFKRVAPIPVPLGTLKAGEKRTAEIRGRLGTVSESSQGELIIGIILSEGLPPGTHSIRTEIQPGSSRKQPTQ